MSRSNQTGFAVFIGGAEARTVRRVADRLATTPQAVVRSLVGALLGEDYEAARLIAERDRVLARTFGRV